MLSWIFNKKKRNSLRRFMRGEESVDSGKLALVLLGK